MKGAITLLATAALVGVGLLALPDPPPTPYRGIVVVPGREPPGGMAGQDMPPQGTSLGAKPQSGTQIDPHRPMPAGAGEDLGQGPVWDDGGEPNTWAAPEPFGPDD